MRVMIGSIAVAAVTFTSVAAAAHPRQAQRAPAVHPEVAAMIKSNQRSPYVPNAGLYEWRQAMDTHTGVPPLISGSSQANPWVDRHQFMPGSGMRRY